MTYSNLKSQISLEALSLAEGETSRSVCPQCKAEHEKSLSITKHSRDYITFKCWRASCGFRGKLGEGGSRYRPGKTLTRPQFTARPFLDPYSNPPMRIMDELLSRYDITNELVRRNGVKYCENRDRLIMPVYDIDGKCFGHIAKRWEHGDGEEKVLNYFVKERPKLHVPKSRNSSTFIVLVEDVLSALSLSSVYTSYALLGTELSEEAALSIRKKTDSLVLALDPDALHKAVKIRKSYQHLFTTIKVLNLPADPKDLPISTIKEHIEEKE